MSIIMIRLTFYFDLQEATLEFNFEFFEGSLADGREGRGFGKKMDGGKRETEL